MPRQPCIDTRILPADVFAIRDEVFYDLVKLISGSKIAKLLKWQELSNAATFLMCPDPLEFLYYESNDIIQLKQETCLKLNDNSFIVLPGIRSGCDELRALLSKKKDEEAKGSNRHNPHAILTPVHLSSLPLVALPSVTTTVSSPPLPLALTSIQSRLTTKSIVDHLALINKNIQAWIEKIKVKLSIPRLLLVDATDYRIEVAPAMDSAYIVCQCGVRSTLGKYKESFVLSNYFRHLQSPKCTMMKKKKHESSMISQASHDENDDNNAEEDNGDSQQTETPIITPTQPASSSRRTVAKRASTSLVSSSHATPEKRVRRKK